jgi:hypothetical protein
MSIPDEASHFRILAWPAKHGSFALNETDIGLALGVWFAGSEKHRTVLKVLMQLLTMVRNYDLDEKELLPLSDIQRIITFENQNI